MFSSNVKCDVDGTYYPHLLLIPAVSYSRLLFIGFYLQNQFLFSAKLKYINCNIDLKLPGGW